MIAKVVWIEAIIQRPAMRWRSSRSARRALSLAKRSVSAARRPIVLARSTPETESDSSTSEERSASEPCLVVAMARRTLPIRRVSTTKTGSSAKAGEGQAPVQQQHRGGGDGQQHGEVEAGDEQERAEGGLRLRGVVALLSSESVELLRLGREERDPGEERRREADEAGDDPELTPVEVALQHHQNSARRTARA